MNTANINIDNKNTVAINGVLDITTAEDVYQIGKKIIQDKSQDNQHCVFDFANIGKSDSAALATLIAWSNVSIKKNKPIRFINLPEQMLSIARLCGLSEILEVKCAN